MKEKKLQALFNKVKKIEKYKKVSLNEQSSFDTLDKEEIKKRIEFLFEQNRIDKDIYKLFNLLEKNFTKEIQDLKIENSLLNLSRSRMLAILDSISDLVLVTDENNKIVLINPPAQILLKDNRINSLGEYLWKVFKDKEFAQFLCSHFLDVLEEKKIQIVKRKFYQTDENQIYFNIYIAPIFDANKKIIGVITVFHNVTEIVRTEELKDEFLSMISHELRTPLTSIQAYTDTLLMQMEDMDKDTLQEFLTVIKTESDRLKNLVNDLLDIAKIEAKRIRLNIEEINVIEVIKERIKLHMQNIKNKKLRLNLQLPDNKISISTDKLRFTQIIDNLISNAIKYNKEEGILTIKLELTNINLILSVEDTGAGINKENLNKIFDKFYRLDNKIDRQTEGTGLGLAITKNLAELLHGRIWVKSEIGKGSIFYIELPR